MKQHRVLSFGIAAALAVVSSACVAPGGPAATFNMPQKAKSMKVAFVRAFAECIGSDPCAPAPLSTYEFGPKGACSAKAGGKVVAPCPRGGYAACYELSVLVKCKDIVSGTGPIEGAGWQLEVAGRITAASGDPTNIGLPIGSITWPDGYVTLDFPDASKGNLQLKSKAAFDELVGTFVPSDAALPPEGTTLELTDLAILDPDGNRFAIVGLGTRPAM